MEGTIEASLVVLLLPVLMMVGTFEVGLSRAGDWEREERGVWEWGGESRGGS